MRDWQRAALGALVCLVALAVFVIWGFSDGTSTRGMLGNSFMAPRWWVWAAVSPLWFAGAVLLLGRARIERHSRASSRRRLAPTIGPFKGWRLSSLGEGSRLLISVSLILGSLGVLFWQSLASYDFWGAQPEHPAVWPLWSGGLGFIAGVALLIAWRKQPQARRSATVGREARREG